MQRVAERRRVPTDELMVSFISGGVRRARSGWARRSLLFVTGPIVTALVIVALFWVLPLAPRIPPPPTISVYLIFLTALHWMRVFFETLFPWPATFILIAAIFFGSRSAFGNLLDLFGLFRRVRFFGAEIELNEQTKRKLQAAASDISGAMSEYKTRVNIEVARLVSRHQLDRVVAQFVEDVALNEDPGSGAFGRKQVGAAYRCTIHIPDPVQEGYLYQLLNYYPGGGGAFRSYSDRYGIIGKVWRSEESQVVGNLLSDSGELTREQKIARITRDWGMTKHEAERSLRKPSYICFLLEHKGDKIGVLYMDSEKRDAWVVPASGGNVNMTEDQLDNSIRKKANEMLSPRVQRLLDELADVSLRIDLQQTP
ncbi:MAG: hypothetical protein ACJ8AH_08375 [Stellaceae bacterium]